jgi:hypothetical protein
MKKKIEVFGAKAFNRFNGDPCYHLEALDGVPLGNNPSPYFSVEDRAEAEMVLDVWIGKGKYTLEMEDEKCSAQS